jgi:putative glycosyltransferase
VAATPLTSGTEHRREAAMEPPGDRPSTLPATRPELSIVSTMYRSRPFLERFLSDCEETLKLIGCTRYEVVLVNDGSPDDSLQYALHARETRPWLIVVDLSRNFGHHHAMQAGLRFARGDHVFLIDCDLEVAPSSLREFRSVLERTNADVVFGYQQARKGGWFEQVSGGLFWKFFNALSETKIPENILTERLMSRRYVDALLQLGDVNLFLAGMMTWTGFLQVGIPVAKTQRDGRSTYTLLRRLQLMVNAVSSFSAKPLHFLFNIGLLITVLSFSYAAYLVIRKVFFGDALLGFTSIMAVLLLSLGILTTALGILGIYLGRIFRQVQNRPSYIVKDVHR